MLETQPSTHPPCVPKSLPCCRRQQGGQPTRPYGRQISPHQRHCCTIQTPFCQVNRGRQGKLLHPLQGKHCLNDIKPVCRQCPFSAHAKPGFDIHRINVHRTIMPIQFGTPMPATGPLVQAQTKIHGQRFSRLQSVSAGKSAIHKLASKNGLFPQRPGQASAERACR
ncbi:hypothetical protein SDC9_186068 [bioreactor metagenome]|uniref:Uncharacterized protein n=1 Tax=bioreactor metagenome TaxID=1076179 RepID=A0A645HQY2_9ZZZZ